MSAGTITRADVRAMRISAIVARLEARFDRADDPTCLRVTRDGRKQIGGHWSGSRCVLWTTVEWLSTELLRRGYGRRHEDDGVPF